MTTNKIPYIDSDNFGHVNPVRIDLQNNDISFIEAGSFGPNLTFIQLACNLLQEINPNWFQDPSNLITLHVTGNKITHLQAGVFKRFKSLKEISMSFNRIKTIGAGAFPPLNTIQWITLAYNNLTELPDNAFKSGHISMRFLELHYNNLSFLPSKLLDRLQVFEKVILDGNPWQCPCYNKTIIKWVNWDSYGTLYWPKDAPNQPRCVVADRPNPHECVERVDNELIEYFTENRDPAMLTRDKFCDCSRIKDPNECFYIHDKK